MEITAVKIRKIENGGNLRAVAEVTFDNELTVKDVRLIDGQNGWFAAMPSRKGSDGRFRDVVYVHDRASQDQISDVVIEAYEKNSSVREVEK
ncbi:MAG: SpoVG family protein [Parasporobacterium sp.]|nr:SpoVG family protein [Parasporobacterium sp.]